MWWGGRGIQTVGLTRGRGGAERSDGHRENRCPPCGDREFESFSSASGSVSAGQIFAAAGERLAFVAGRLTDSRRSAGPPGTGSTISAWLSQTTSRTRAAHESPRTTKLYDRTGDEIALDEVELITI